MGGTFDLLLRTRQIIPTSNLIIQSGEKKVLACRGLGVVGRGSGGGGGGGGDRKRHLHLLSVLGVSHTKRPITLFHHPSSARRKWLSTVTHFSNRVLYGRNPILPRNAPNVFFIFTVCFATDLIWSHLKSRVGANCRASSLPPARLTAAIILAFCFVEGDDCARRATMNMHGR